MAEHKTRFSDSSVVDLVCVYCGATEGPFHNNLKGPCPVSDPVTRADMDLKQLASKQFRTREWNRITGDNKPIPTK